MDTGGGTDCAYAGVGAVMAITRATWDAVGRFDEGYYPAYYEDCDYCYRATRRGIRTAHVPAARVVHLQDGTRLASDPIRVAANHHFVRYRFVAKHWESEALAEFFPAEHARLETPTDFDRLIQHVLAARTLLRRLDDVLACRQRDLDARPDLARRAQLQAGFAGLLASGMAAAEHADAAASAASASGSRRSLAEVKEEEAAILRHLQRRRDDAPALRRWLRTLLVRPLRVLTGREHALLVELAGLQRARLDALEAEPPDPRLRLLRILAEYDEP